MADRDLPSSSILLLVLIFSLVVASYASAGNADPLYRSCVENCENTGYVEEKNFKSCKVPVNGASMEAARFMQEPLYLRWKEWDCRSDCRYHCMVKREADRESLGQKPVKYHGKWPFKRVFGFQEPVSVALSVFNLSLQFHGWLSFLIIVYYKLPLRPQNRSTYYDFTGLWNIYGILYMNAWFWSAFFHSRDVELTEKLDYSSAMTLVGYSLIIAILWTLNVRDEAARVMVPAPLIAFVTTHILYLNFYELDYGLNIKVCVVMGVTQLLLWAIWAGVTSHQARYNYKVWAVVIGEGLAMLLKIYDFPPIWGYVDAHAVWHATTVPFMAIVTIMRDL